MYSTLGPLGPDRIASRGEVGRRGALSPFPLGIRCVGQAGWVKTLHFSKWTFSFETAGLVLALASWKATQEHIPSWLSSLCFLSVSICVSLLPSPPHSMPVPIHQCVETTSWHQVSSSLTLTPLETGSFAEPGAHSPLKLVWLPSELQGAACLHLPPSPV